jgi:hypothetical protein
MESIFQKLPEGGQKKLSRQSCDVLIPLVHYEEQLACELLTERLFQRKSTSADGTQPFNLNEARMSLLGSNHYSQAGRHN